MNLSEAQSNGKYVSLAGNQLLTGKLGTPATIDVDDNSILTTKGWVDTKVSTAISASQTTASSTYASLLAPSTQPHTANGFVPPFQHIDAEKASCVSDSTITSNWG